MPLGQGPWSDRPGSIPSRDGRQAARRAALLARTFMWPGYQTSSGFQSGAARARVASASRLGGGHPTMAKRIRAGPAKCGVTRSRSGGEARVGARDERLDLHRRVFFPVYPVVAGAGGAGAHVDGLAVALDRPLCRRGSLEPAVAVVDADGVPGREGDDAGDIGRRVLIQPGEEGWGSADAEWGDHEPEAPIADERRWRAPGITRCEKECRIHRRPAPGPGHRAGRRRERGRARLPPPSVRYCDPPKS